MWETLVKEKAQRYDEALERAKQFITKELYAECNGRLVEYIFPELKENRDDERIMKDIIEMLRNWASVHYITKEQFSERMAWLEKKGQVKESIISQHEIATCKENNDSLTGKDEKIREAICDCVKLFSFDSCFFKYVSQEECLAWIEKQGEQKPASKFKDGDWVVNKNGEPRTFKVIRRSWPDALLQEYKTGKLSHVNVMTLDKQYRLWDITKEAKDGDVLANNIGIILFRKIGNEKYADVVDYHGAVSTRGVFEIQENFDYWGKTKDGQLQPATKEQRNTLMKAMADAGYTFDFEKKELKKIEQKPAWSEEDKSYLSHVFTAVKAYYTDDKGHENPWREELLRWLKSLKDRVQPQHQQEWNEENEEEFQIAIDTLVKAGQHGSADWLKSLKERYTWKPSEEQIKICKEVYADMLSAKGFDVGTVNSEINRLEEQLNKL